MSASVEAWPAGWYPDPWGLREQRFWNGSEWTAYIANRAAARGKRATAAPADDAPTLVLPGR